ncbi:conserved hypothetical protein [Vibrio phage 236O40-1]|nr:conserved hypothetical protein [Vibrio phage 236O40-1]
MAKIFEKDEVITASQYDLSSGVWVQDKEVQATKGFSLESGLTPDICPKIKGKVGVFDQNSESWSMHEDDRGRVFYNKFDGSEHLTSQLGELVDRKQFTQITPPKTKDDELLFFVSESQEWVVGLDWYEKPIWDAEQNKSFFTGDFFIPNSDHTNIEPPAPGLTLNDAGQWVAPPEEEAPPEA